MNRSGPMPDTLPFRKMQGLGNDFVVIDLRDMPVAFTQPQLERIADRRFGIGCDQLILLETSSRADVRMRIFNPDGGEVGACGNATRCIAMLIGDETGKDAIRIETQAGLLVGTRRDGLIAVDMGLPELGWQQIPLAGIGSDTLRVPLDVSAIEPRLPGWFTAVNMGNPHGIFLVEDAKALPLAVIGPQLETHPIFPEKANISLVSPAGPNQFIVRVWERAAGITLACGTAACAVAVAVARLGLAEGRITINLPGGDLVIERDAQGHVIMIGAAATSFTGVLSGAWLAGSGR